MEIFFPENLISATAQQYSTIYEDESIILLFCKRTNILQIGTCAQIYKKMICDTSRGVFLNWKYSSNLLKNHFHY